MQKEKYILSVVDKEEYDQLWSMFSDKFFQCTSGTVYDSVNNLFNDLYNKIYFNREYSTYDELKQAIVVEADHAPYENRLYKLITYSNLELMEEHEEFSRMLQVFASIKPEETVKEEGTSSIYQKLKSMNNLKKKQNGVMSMNIVSKLRENPILDNAIEYLEDGYSIDSHKPFKRYLRYHQDVARDNLTGDEFAALVEIIKMYGNNKLGTSASSLEKWRDYVHTHGNGYPDLSAFEAKMFNILKDEANLSEEWRKAVWGVYSAGMTLIHENGLGDTSSFDALFE